MCGAFDNKASIGEIYACPEIVDQRQIKLPCCYLTSELLLFLSYYFIVTQGERFP